MSVAQVPGHGAGGLRGDVLPGPAEGGRDRVGLRRVGQVDYGVGQVELRLGQAHELDGPGGGLGGGRIGAGRITENGAMPLTWPNQLDGRS